MVEPLMCSGSWGGSSLTPCGLENHRLQKQLWGDPEVYKPVILMFVPTKAEISLYWNFQTLLKFGEIPSGVSVRICSTTGAQIQRK